jgi:hypothetical protein
MCIEKNVKTSGIKSFVELRRYATCVNPTIANEKTTSFPEKTKAFQDTASETLKVGATVRNRNPIEMRNL